MSEYVPVSEQEFAKAEAVFRSDAELEFGSVPVDEAAVAERIRARNSRAVILTGAPYVGPLYDALAETGGAQGAIIARFGVGHDGIDKALARARGIVVATTPGTLDVSVAEHALWLMGGLAKHIPPHDRDFRAGNWRPVTGLELEGKALGVIGFGAIGRRVAAKAHFGLGMRVSAADCRPASELEAAEGKPIEEINVQFGVERYTTDVEAVLAEADVVSIHMPANPETRNFFNADRLARMKPGALLINTARGAVVDECALYDALAEGRLAGAGLDVFQSEPYAPARPDKDLRTLRNVVLTPHIASNTAEANARMGRMCIANIRAFFAGRMEDIAAV